MMVLFLGVLSSLLVAPIAEAGALSPALKKNPVVQDAFFRRVSGVDPEGSTEKPDNLIHTIRTASFKSLGRALDEIETLRKLGFHPFLLGVYDHHHQLWYTVNIGKHSCRLAAKNGASELFRKAKIKASVLSIPSAIFSLFMSRVPNQEPEGKPEDDRVYDAVKKIPDPIVPASGLDHGLSSAGPEDSLTNENDRTSQADAEPEQAESDRRQNGAPGQESEWGGAQGQVEGAYYVLVGLGVSHTNKGSGDLDAALANNGYTITSDIDQTNVGWKFVGGYRFAQSFSVEAGYIHFQDLDIQVGASPLTSELADEVVKHVPLTMKGVIVEGVGAWEVTSLTSIIGKAGGFLWAGGVMTGDQGINAARDDAGLAPILGVGAELQLIDGYVLRLEYERFFTPDAMDFVSAGFRVGF